MARHARIAVDSNGLTLAETSARWTTCPVCRSEYTGNVSLALSWRYLKTYAELDDRDCEPEYALAQLSLGAAMFKTGAVGEATYHLSRYLDIRHDDELAAACSCARTYLARCHESLGNIKLALDLRREELAAQGVGCRKRMHYSFRQHDLRPGDLEGLSPVG